MTGSSRFRSFFASSTVYTVKTLLVICFFEGLRRQRTHAMRRRLLFLRAYAALVPARRCLSRAHTAFLRAYAALNLPRQGRPAPHPEENASAFSRSFKQCDICRVDFAFRFFFLSYFFLSQKEVSAVSSPAVVHTALSRFSCFTSFLGKRSELKIPPMSAGGLKNANPRFLYRLPQILRALTRIFMPAATV